MTLARQDNYASVEINFLIEVLVALIKEVDWLTEHVKADRDWRNDVPYSIQEKERVVLNERESTSRTPQDIPFMKKFLQVMVTSTSSNLEYMGVFLSALFMS